MTIAVDFDGTITQRNAYPDIGPFRKNAINVLKALQEKGNDICLWTCRHGETLAQALTNLKVLIKSLMKCVLLLEGLTKLKKSSRM